MAKYDSAAVVTIQGGGIYGFSVLGELSGLLARGIKPIALAGTSAGAIVSTLYWAGYKPVEIRDKFAELAKTGELLELLGPFVSGNGEKNFKKLRSVYYGLSGGDPDKGFLARMANHAGRPAWLLTVGVPRMRHYVKNKGVFPAGELTRAIDDWIRNSPRLARRGIKFPESKWITFGDVRNLMAIDEVDDVMVRSMYQIGEQTALERLAKVDFTLPDDSATGEIQGILTQLVEKAYSVLPPSPVLDVGFRANVYVPQKQKLRQLYRYNMDDKLEIDENAETHWKDPKVAAIIDIMLASASRLGEELGAAFARRTQEGE